MAYNKSGKMNQSNTGSKSNNFETNTSTQDLVLAETAFLQPEKKNEIDEEDAKQAVILSNEVTSIDFMMPEEEREILEKNLNMYGNIQEMKKVLNAAKANKVLSEDIKTLELISKTGEFSNQLFDLLMNEDNIEVLQKYIQRKFEEGDIAKAYKEVGLLNKAMLDVREGMLNKLKAGKSGKTAKIALKFTNDSGQDFQLGAEIDT